MKRKEKRIQQVKEKAEAAVEAYRTVGTQTDPNGMYTGLTNEVQQAVAEGKVYINPKDIIPTQDADDL